MRSKLFSNHLHCLYRSLVNNAVSLTTYSVCYNVIIYAVYCYLITYVVSNVLLPSTLSTVLWPPTLFNVVWPSTIVWPLTLFSDNLRCLRYTLTTYNVLFFDRLRCLDCSVVFYLSSTLCSRPTISTQNGDVNERIFCRNWKSCTVHFCLEIVINMCIWISKSKVIIFKDNKNLSHCCL